VILCVGKGLLIFGEKIMRYRIFIEQDEDGIFVAECPSLPGCISQGNTRKEAIENIQDAIRGYLESLEKHGGNQSAYQ
jgi:predicted RNase H-like HicB family nuclease